jgi:putative transposase
VTNKCKLSYAVAPNQVWAGDVGACWDNAVVERFFGSLKHDWLLKVPQPTRKQMRNDVMANIRYYNLERFHAANGALSPVEYEKS